MFNTGNTVITVKELDPVTSCVREQNATTTLARHRSI